MPMCVWPLNLPSKCGSSALTDAAVNCGFVRQTIATKGHKFLSAPTRSLRDRVFSRDGPPGVRPAVPRATRPPLLYRGGIQGDPICEGTKECRPAPDIDCRERCERGRGGASAGGGQVPIQ
jgi:hypothetical protein